MTKFQNIISPVWILVGLLVVTAFLAGGFYTRLREVEKKQSGSAFITPSATKIGPQVLSPEQMTQLTQSGQVLGEATAKVTMIEFADFQCPYCAWYAQETFPQINKEYIKTGKIRYVFYHFPLFGHQYAQKAAEAAECAGDQGKFWEMHDKMFASQNKISLTDLKQYASDLSLKTTEFNACLDESKFKDKVESDLKLGESLGVSSTPAFFINGRLISGAYPFANFKQVIEEELGK